MKLLVVQKNVEPLEQLLLILQVSSFGRLFQPKCVPSTSGSWSNIAFDLKETGGPIREWTYQWRSTPKIIPSPKMLTPKNFPRWPDLWVVTPAIRAFTAGFGGCVCRIWEFHRRICPEYTSYHQWICALSLNTRVIIGGYPRYDRIREILADMRLQNRLSELSLFHTPHIIEYAGYHLFNSLDTLFITAGYVGHYFNMRVVFPVYASDFRLIFSIYAKNADYLPFKRAMTSDTRFIIHWYAYYQLIRGLSTYTRVIIGKRGLSQ